MNVLQTIRDFLKFSAVNNFNSESTTGKVENLRLLVLNNYNELVSILISDIPGGGGGTQDLQSVLDNGHYAESSDGNSYISLLDSTPSGYENNLYIANDDFTSYSFLSMNKNNGFLGATQGTQSGFINFVGGKFLLRDSLDTSLTSVRFAPSLGIEGETHIDIPAKAPRLEHYTLTTLEDIAELRNEQGQVKVNYTGLSTTGFTAEVVKILDINAATPTLVSSPTTIFPYSTPNTYSGFFDSARGSSPTGRLIENPVEGQVHTWRFQIGYSAKGVSNNGSFDLILTNPVSGFQYVMPFTLPSGRTSGTLNNVAITIADEASIPSPNGYILQCRTSFTDANLAINSISITRISQAVENI